MSNIDDLRMAFQDLNKGAQEAATYQAINDAQMQVDQIKSNIVADAKQRQALQQTANDLTLKLAGLGASGQQIQSAFSAIAPKIPNSPTEALLQGYTMGDTSMIDVANQTLTQLDLAQIPGENRAEARSIRGDERAMAMAIGKLNATGVKLDKVSSKDLQPFMEYGSTIEKAQSVYSYLNDPDIQGFLGPISARITPTSMEAYAKQDTFEMQVRQLFDSYRTAVTGAGASPGELKILEKSMPTVYDRPANFKKKLEEVDRQAKAIMRRNLNTLRAVNKDVGQLESMIGAPLSSTNRVANYSNTVDRDIAQLAARYPNDPTAQLLLKLTRQKAGR